MPVDLATGEGLGVALAGVEAVYVIAPNVNAREVEMVRHIADAAVAVGIPRVVYHSVMHPDDTAMPHHLRKHEAEKLLREAIDDQREPVLVRLYGELVLPDALTPLDRAESWLRKAPEDPDLLAACARLALQAELIGKSRSYLEASLARKPSAENSLLYAELLDQLGEGDRARTVLRDSVARSVGRRPALPRVRLRRR